MCRLYGIRCSAPTKVECTLIHAQNALMIQSQSDLSGLSHTDGWGISYYSDGGQPTLERRTTAAFEDLHFASTVEKVFARTVVAHVRRATIGKVSLPNTHPFTFDCWSFAHNGTVSAFSQIESRLLADCLPPFRRRRLGATDSELAFLWLLSQFARRGFPIGEPGLDGLSLLGAFRDCVRWLAGECLRLDPGAVPRLNFLLTNGELLLACRLNRSLFWVERDGIHDCEICGIPHIDTGQGPYRAVVVASEPISEEPWQEIPQAHALLISSGLEVTIVPLELALPVSG